MMKKLTLAVLSTFFVMGQTAWAEEEENVIEIVKKAVKAPTVAIVPFANNAKISSIISEDLTISGKLSLDTDLPEKPHYAKNINVSLWRNAGIPYVVVGRVVRKGSTDLVAFNLLDVDKVTSLYQGSLAIQKGKASETAHQIADIIYEVLTGKKSDFSGRIAYVLEQKNKQGKTYKIVVSGTDGKNAQTVFSSSQPIRSLSWSPNGQKLAYVSYQNNRPEIYALNVYAGTTQNIASYKGTNDSPTFSPDGNKVLFTSSKTGNFDIYLKNLRSGKVRQLTKHKGYDTDPHFAPDGKSFVFTSDRSGSPQIYQHSLLTGQTRRLTLVGSYNTRPRFNKDGSKITLIHNYRTAIMDVASGAITSLGGSADDESPSFSPNGDVVIYATKVGGKDRIKMIAANGQSKRNLPAVKGKMRDPAWAPK